MKVIVCVCVCVCVCERDKVIQHLHLIINEISKFYDYLVNL